MAQNSSGQNNQIEYEQFCISIKQLTLELVSEM